MLVEIWSDIVCPFCYIAKRQFEKALAQFEHAAEVEVRYHSYELNPSAPAESSGNLHEYLARHKGVSVEEAKAMNADVTEYAASVGLHYDLDHAHPANSFNAHRLVHLAAKYKKQGEMVEHLHSAYFVEGIDIGEKSNLVQIAVDVGLDGKEVGRMLAGDEYVAAVGADEAEAHKIGVEAVPFFLFDRVQAIVGARASRDFLEALKIVWKNNV